MRRALLIAGLMAVGVGSPAQAAPPKISQLVVFRDGSAQNKTVSTRATRVSVAGRRCTAGDGTALAALVRSKPGKLRLHDFGSCTRRASDGAGLFVRSIDGDANRGQNGWVYKVGRRRAPGLPIPAGHSAAACCARASASPGSTAACATAGASARSSSS